MKERDKIALEVMKIFLNHQGQRRRTLWSRFTFWLGLNNWTQNFDYNFEDIAKKSYEMADSMIIEKSK